MGNALPSSPYAEMSRDWTPRSKANEGAMDKSKITSLRAFHVDGGWYDAYWLQQTRTNVAPSTALVVAAWLARLGRLAVNVISARQVFSAMPCELKPYLNGDDVARARQLL